MSVAASSSSSRQWGVYTLTAATSDTSPSLLLVFDNQRYLFNAGEGTTRAFVARSAGFKKLETIFATRASSTALQGLPGLLLTLAEHHGDESVATKVNLVLPRGAAHLLACSRFHARRNMVDLKLHETPAEASQSPMYQDRHITVYAYPSSPPSSSSPSRKRKRSTSPETNGHARADPSTFLGSKALTYVTNVIHDMFHGPSHVPISPRPTPAWDTRQLPRPPKDDTAASISYLVFGPRQRGKFRPDLAKQLGVVPGPAFGKLHNGERVQAKDGSWVEPADCVEADGPRNAFLVVDCPSSASFDSLKTAGIDGALEAEKGTLKLVFHQLGPGVALDESYWAWASSITEAEVVSSPDLDQDRISFGGAYLQQLRLHTLDPSLFPLPHASLDSAASPSSIPSLPSKTSLWQADARYELGVGQFAFNGVTRDFDFPSFPSPEADARLPQLYVKRGETPYEKQLVAAGEEAWRDFVELREVAQKEVREEEEKRQDRAKGSMDDVIVTTLGTGSASPAQYRNVSSTLVETPAHGSLLLDCGENTLGQLQRLFGPTRSADVLRTLRLICISHMHADHHAGLASLLRARSLLPDIALLTIVAPRLIWIGLQDHDAFEPLGLDNVRFVQAYTLIKEGAMPKESLESTALRSVKFVEVDHRGGQCFGVVIDHTDGWRLVYSGDTRPCDRLVEAGKDADLIIHEATLDDEHVDSARVKGHSTTGQALDIARRMNARTCLLTHFSQRYPKLPHLGAALTEKSSLDVALAFDMMRLRVGDAWKARHYFAPMSALLRELDPKAAKKEAVRMQTD